LNLTMVSIGIIGIIIVIAAVIALRGKKS